MCGNIDLVRNMLSKINWIALRDAASSVGSPIIPEYEELTEGIKADDLFLKAVHHVLFEIHVIEGFLVCPVTSRKFPIKDGIPNMLLHEDEV